MIPEPPDFHRRNLDFTTGQLDGRVEALEDWVKSINQKLDTLIAAANMGRGAWWALVKVGGTLVMAAGACAWFYEHVIKVGAK